MTWIETRWNASDPRVADLLRQLAAMPEDSVPRLEGEAWLHTLLAQVCLRRAAEVRARQARGTGARV
jgi:hypothetical protein